MLNMFRMLIHPSSGVCDLFVELFHGLYCSVRIDVFALAYLFSGECLVVTWTSLTWFKTGTSGRLLWTRWWTFGFNKILWVSWLADELLASQNIFFFSAKPHEMPSGYQLRLMREPASHVQQSNRCFPTSYSLYQWVGGGGAFIKVLFCYTTADHHAVSRRTLSGVHSDRNSLSECFYSRVTKQTSNKSVMCCVGDLHCYTLKN